MSNSSSLRFISRPALPYLLDCGIGYNWFDFYGIGGVYARLTKPYRYDLSRSLFPAMSDTAAWRAVREGLDELRPGYLRFGLPPDPHVGPDGTFRGDTVHFQRLQWLDAWATANGCTIQLDTYDFHFSRIDRN